VRALEEEEVVGPGACTSVREGARVGLPVRERGGSEEKRGRLGLSRPNWPSTRVLFFFF
jgi:hypothetical protein